MKRSDWNQATWYLVFCCMVFNWGNVLFGIDVSSFGALQALPSWLRQFGVQNPEGVYVLDTDRRAIMNGVVFLGKLVGACLFEPVIERVGCKKTLYIGAVIQIIGIVLELSAKEWIQFTTGRVLTYLAVGLVDTTVPTYEAELAPAPLRGFFAGNVQVFVHIGAIWGSSMSRAFATEQGRVGWMVPVGVQMIPAVMLLMLVPFCIESPRWLIYRGRKDEAIMALNKIRRQADIDQGLTVAEADAVEQALDESKQTGQGRWRDLLRKSHRGRTLIVTIVFFFNQTTGQQFANSYGPTFFRSIGLGPVDTFTYSILIPVVGLIACLSAVALTDIIGRRPLCYLGALGAVLFAALIGSIGSMPDSSSNPTKSNLVVASVILLNGACKFGVASQCYLIASEIGGTQLRKKMLAWATIADVVFAFVTVFNIPYLQNGPAIQLGARLGYVFMVLAVISFFFFVLCLPELKGRSLEEVDELFSRKLWAWQFSKAETYGVGAEIRGIERGGFESHEVKREDNEGDGSQDDDNRTHRQVYTAPSKA